MEGDSEKQAARFLKMSLHTVHQYTKRVYRAFGVHSRGELLAMMMTEYMAFAKLQLDTQRAMSQLSPMADAAITEWQPFRFTLRVPNPWCVTDDASKQIEANVIRAAINGEQGIHCLQFAPKGCRVWCALFPADATAYLLEVDREERRNFFSAIEAYYLSGKVLWIHSRLGQPGQPFPLPPPPKIKPLASRIDVVLDKIASGQCKTYRLETRKPPNYSPDAVRSIREKFRMSPPGFGSLIGVSGALVSQWEVGKSIPPPVARRLMDRLLADPGGSVAAMVAERESTKG